MDISDKNKALLIKSGVGILLGTAGFIVVRKRMKRKRNSDGTKGGDAPDLGDMDINPKNLTISAAMAAVFANNLYGAMLSWGSDVKLISETIGEINTKDDMLLVIKTFGMRKYLWFGRTQYIGQEYNLIGWLRKELNNSQIAKIKPKFESWGIPL